MSYTNVHRAFLQALLLRPFIDAQEGRELLAAIKSAETNSEVTVDAVTDKDFHNVVHTIQNALTKFHLDIRDMEDQEDGTRCYALVNAANDDIIRFATTHTPDEISYFKRLLDEMFDASNNIYAEIMAIKGLRAISLNKNPPAERENREIVVQGPNGEEERQVIAGAGIGLTKQEAEDCLIRFVDEGWLERNNIGFHFLSTRALLELETYLTETYNAPDEEENEDGTVTKGPEKDRIKFCFHCRCIHTIGERCSDTNCKVRLHSHCAVKVFSKNGKYCPDRECRKEWKGDPVGPKAAKGPSTVGESALRRARGRDSDGIMPQRLSKATQRSIEKSKQRRSTMFGGADGGNAGEEAEEEAVAGPSRPRNSLGRRDRESIEEEDFEDHPPRKISRRTNGTSSRRTSAIRPSEESDESGSEQNLSVSAAATIKRESLANRSLENSRDEDDEEEEEEEHELPRRMSRTTLQSRRR